LHWALPHPLDVGQHGTSGMWNVGAYIPKEKSAVISEGGGGIAHSMRFRVVRLIEARSARVATGMRATAGFVLRRGSPDELMNGVGEREDRQIEGDQDEGDEAAHEDHDGGFD